MGMISFLHTGSLVASRPRKVQNIIDASMTRWSRSSRIRVRHKILKCAALTSCEPSSARKNARAC